MGIVVSGYGLASLLMTTDSYREKMKKWAGDSSICPGTLNLKLSRPLSPSRAEYVEEDDPLLLSLGRKGIWVLPIRLGEESCWALWGDEPGYPENMIEIVASRHLRSSLGLSDGDTVGLAL